MKTGPLLPVGATLTLNVVLLALLVAGRTPPPAPLAPPPVAPAPVAPAPVAAKKIDPDAWPSLQTEELPSLVARLRAAGFPPDVVRAILSAQLGEAYAARRKALDPDADNRPFWKMRQPDPARDLALRQLGREHEKVMRDLLGEEADNDPMSLAYRQRRLTGVPPEKVGQLQQLMREFDEKRSDIYQAGAFAADREKIQALDKAQRAAVAQILTPAEFAEYELRNGRTASQLRYDLSAFNATEAEFRQLFQLKQPFDERFPPMFAVGSPEEMRARSEAQKQLTEQIKAALGPERGEEYVRATDYNYRQASQLVARLELPPATTNQLWSVQESTRERIRVLNTNEALSPAEHATQIAALADEVKTKLTATLGERGLQAYKQYGGQWMQMLQPRPTPTPPRN